MSWVRKCLLSLMVILNKAGTGTPQTVREDPALKKKNRCWEASSIAMFVFVHMPTIHIERALSHPYNFFKMCHQPQQ